MSIFHCRARMPGGGSGTPEGTKWSPTIVINGGTWGTYQWPKHAGNIWIPFLKLTFSYLKMDAWKTFSFPFWGVSRPIFRGEPLLLVSREHRFTGVAFIPRPGVMGPASQEELPSLSRLAAPFGREADPRFVEAMGGDKLLQEAAG